MSWYPAGACHSISESRQTVSCYIDITTAYLLQIFPISLVRFLTFNTTYDVGHGWTILASVCFASSGMINMLLWLLTGRQFGFTLPPSDDDEEGGGRVSLDELSNRRSGDAGSGSGDLNGNANAVRMRPRTAGSGGGDGAAGDLSADSDTDVIMAVLPKSPSLTGMTLPVHRRGRSTHESVGIYDAGHGGLPVSATPIGMAAGVTSEDDNDDDRLGPPPWDVPPPPHPRHPLPPHLRSYAARSLSRSSKGDESLSSPRRSIGGGRSSRSGYAPDTISMTSVTTGTGVVDSATFAQSLQYPADNNIMGLGVGTNPVAITASGCDGMAPRSFNTSPSTTLSSNGAGRSSPGAPSPSPPIHDLHFATTTTTPNGPQPS